MTKFYDRFVLRAPGLANPAFAFFSPQAVFHACVKRKRNKIWWQLLQKFSFRNRLRHSFQDLVKRSMQWIPIRLAFISNTTDVWSNPFLLRLIAILFPIFSIWYFHKSMKYSLNACVFFRNPFCEKHSTNFLWPSTCLHLKFNFCWLLFMHSDLPVVRTCMWLHVLASMN